jgi:hypothetical protein
VPRSLAVNPAASSSIPGKTTGGLAGGASASAERIAQNRQRQLSWNVAIVRRRTGVQKLDRPDLLRISRILPTMKNPYHALLMLIAGATQKELAAQIQYLKAELEIARSKLPERVTFTAQERNRLIKFGQEKGISPGQEKGISPIFLSHSSA